MEACEKCGGVLKREGKARHESLFGGGAHEVHEFHRCAKCGLLWDNIEESGDGGHGNVWIEAEDQSTRK